MVAHVTYVSSSSDWHKDQIRQMEIHIASLHRRLVNRTNRDMSENEIRQMLHEANMRLVQMRIKYRRHGKNYGTG